ncbi:MAG: SAM-dependent methyltransferase [Clostridia bacterium]|nr:SAM-dependent methyltransferase [Clostridia bacterium]
MVHLDNRLHTIAEMIGQVDTLYDIGANHGLLSAYLLQAGLCRHACITDISPASLNRARYNITKTGLLDRTEFRVTDGLSGLSPAVQDGIVIAGMGTQVISGILAGACTHAPFVLQPNLNAPELRKYLYANGFRIEEERICRAAGRFYICLRTSLSDTRIRPSLQDLWIGGICQDPLFPAYLQWRQHVLSKALAGAQKGNDPDSVRALEEELSCISGVLS